MALPPAQCSTRALANFDSNMANFDNQRPADFRYIDVAQLLEVTMPNSEILAAQEPHSVHNDLPSLQEAESQFHPYIERALIEFGLDQLTPREQHVIQLILLGLPSKVAATKLQIAPKTEKVHRRNAYAKLGVNSQTALFRQFLGFLSATWAKVEPCDRCKTKQECACVPGHHGGQPRPS